VELPDNMDSVLLSFDLLVGIRRDKNWSSIIEKGIQDAGILVKTGRYEAILRVAINGNNPCTAIS
jgi:hypothetical protein